MAGILYGVGVGPGDPELLTQKAVRVLSDCGVIGIPGKNRDFCTAWSIAVQAVPEIAGKEVISVAVPMTKDKSRLNSAYRAGCTRLAAALNAGQNVAFLNLGDPTLYGSYMEFHRRIRAMGYCAEIISGVPSICAVAAALDTPLGERDESIRIFPGNYDLSELDKMDGTNVLMKPASKLPELKQQLLELEQAGGYSVSAVVNCGMSDQKICPSIQALPENAGYFVTILIKKNDADNGIETDLELGAQK